MNLRFSIIGLIVLAGSALCIGQSERPHLQRTTSETTVSTYENIGQLWLTHLPDAPFPHPSRTEGHRYKTNFFSAADHYQDETVAIFIPKNFQPATKVDFVVHFHGWYNNVTNVLRHYELPEQMVASEKNAILIVPQGPRNAPDSFGGKLEDPDGFKRFMTEVMKTLQKQERFKKCAIGRIILSGHSGGYQVISSILSVGGMTSSIQEVWLFDALYGKTDRFQTWFKNSNGRLINIYTAKGGTKQETENLISNLKQEKAPFFSAEEMAITAEELRKHRLNFIFTELSHDEVLNKHKTFLQFLQASSLDSLR